MDTTYHLIQSRLDLLHINNVTINYTSLVKDLVLDDISGIIITGSRIPDEGTPDLPPEIIKSKVPKLGICFGHEILAIEAGAELKHTNADVGERISNKLRINKSPIFEGLDTSVNYIVDMNHRFEIKSLPKGYTTICSTNMTPIAGYQNLDKKIFGLQFHPERSPIGDVIFKNFHQMCVGEIEHVI